MDKPVHILSRTTTTRGVVNLSALAVVDAQQTESNPDQILEDEIVEAV
jgi:hypothetical protein